MPLLLSLSAVTRLAMLCFVLGVIAGTLLTR